MGLSSRYTKLKSLIQHLMISNVMLSGYPVLLAKWDNVDSRCSPRTICTYPLFEGTYCNCFEKSRLREEEENLTKLVEQLCYF